MAMVSLFCPTSTYHMIVVNKATSPLEQPFVYPVGDRQDSSARKPAFRSGSARPAGFVVLEASATSPRPSVTSMPIFRTRRNQTRRGWRQSHPRTCGARRSRTIIAGAADHAGDPDRGGRRPETDQPPRRFRVGLWPNITSPSLTAHRHNGVAQLADPRDGNRHDIVRPEAE